MTYKTLAVGLVGMMALSACAGGLDRDTAGPDKTRDLGSDEKDLSQLIAGIWIDPNGCDHWIIDDGIEGYLSSRLSPNGKPVCTGHGAETVAYGPFKSGSASVNSSTEN
ncbi:MAG: hypothetical protein ACPG5U_00810 [Planktomarina sp.]